MDPQPEPCFFLLSAISSLRSDVTNPMTTNIEVRQIGTLIIPACKRYGQGSPFRATRVRQIGTLRGFLVFELLVPKVRQIGTQGSANWYPRFDKLVLWEIGSSPHHYWPERYFQGSGRYCRSGKYRRCKKSPPFQKGGFLLPFSYKTNDTTAGPQNYSLAESFRQGPVEESWRLVIDF